MSTAIPQLQGWMADNDGNIDSGEEIDGIQLPINSTIDPIATSEMTLTGNLNSAAADGDSFVRNMEIFDSLGNRHILEITFEKTGDNAWSYTVTSDTGSFDSGDMGNVTFNPVNGHLASGGPINLVFDPDGGAADDQVINIDISTITQQQADESTLAYGQNGYEMGYLDSFKIDSAGKIVGIFTNGLTKNIAQIAVASFVNPAGLEKMGETMFRKSSNSGDPRLIRRESAVAGITPGTLRCPMSICHRSLPI